MEDLGASEIKKKDEITINKTKVKESFGKIIKFFSNKKVQWALVGILLIIVLFWSSSIRLSNLPLLVDETNGESLPIALDPFYFLRVAETMANGSLPQYDEMRYSVLNVPFTNEILPDTLVLLQKISNVFGDYSLAYIDVISPVIFFILGLIVFFIVTYLLTKSKVAATIASIFLAFIPSYLYRSMAGFADHESIGMFAFFLAFVPFIFLIRAYEEKREDYKKLRSRSIAYSIILGILTTFTIVAWAGITRFVFLIFPISFWLFWLFHSDKFNQKTKTIFIGSYIIWPVASILTGMFTRAGMGHIMDWFSGGIEGTIFFFVLGFLIVDFLLIKFGSSIKNTFVQKYRVIASLILTFIIGIILSPLAGINPFAVFSDIFSRLLHPFGIGRVGLTVAENKEAFLEDWTVQIGKRFFWIFLLGSALLGTEIIKKIKENKHKIGFFIVWIILIIGIPLSRISPTSILDGSNFVSKIFYFGSLLLFVIYSVYLYLKNKIVDIEGRAIILVVFLIPMLVATRGAVRLLFVITPLACLMVGYGVSKIIEGARKSKSDISKMATILGGLVVLILLIIGFMSFVGSISSQAKYTGPSANSQWQKAMAWTRENTPEGSLFVHWWDYGYWVQYLGQRPTVTDGGHANGFWDHLIGRYVLTTPRPETALSFMKVHNVSYLLIDQTDLGKYSAYSSIGSDAGGIDRASYISIFAQDSSQTQETNNSTRVVYVGGTALDEDVIFNQDGREILLPRGVAGLGAITMNVGVAGNEAVLTQPYGIFVYNGQQHSVPIKKVYYQDQLVEFPDGVDATIVLIPSIESTNQGIGINELGVVLYLSEKTENSLFAQLYLMDDPNKKYSDLKLVHSEPDPIVASIISQGVGLKDFVYYQGFRGPIKIWEVDVSDNIIGREEFFRENGDYAEFDNLTFIK